jgi:hypothetical protein
MDSPEAVTADNRPKRHLDRGSFDGRFSLRELAAFGPNRAAHRPDPIRSPGCPLAQSPHTVLRHRALIWNCDRAEDTIRIAEILKAISSFGCSIS